VAQATRAVQRLTRNQSNSQSSSSNRDIIDESHLYGERDGILDCSDRALTIHGSTSVGGEHGLERGPESPGCKTYEGTPEAVQFRVAYMQWRKNIADHAGSKKLIQQDCEELRPKFEAALDSEKLPRSRREELQKQFDDTEKGFVYFGDNRATILTMLSGTWLESADPSQP
jgi:hypothetical protein